MDNICQICGEKVTENSHFWKQHKIKEASYYQKFYPKFDLLTKEIISFKSKETYFTTDFTHKNHLKTYLLQKSKEEGLNYLKSWLLKRKECKNLTFAPGEFEVRSFQFPSIKFFHSYYGPNSYEDLCSNIGLKVRYDYNITPLLEQNFKEIIIDTRETKPYKLDLPVKIETLNFADYCPNPNLNNIWIERKEIGDFAGVMSKQYDRFRREIQRAKDNKAYIVILIEAKYSDLLSINYLPQTKWIKATSEFLMKRARDLYLEFDNFQMVAGGNRGECISLFKKILCLKNIQTIDIQYLILCQPEETH